MARSPKNSAQVKLGNFVWGFANVEDNGRAPDSRISTSNDCYSICFQLQLDNDRRNRKACRIVECYEGFPPTRYSLEAKKHMQGQSNVPFNQMAYIVDDQKASFNAMIAQRNVASNIITKEGGRKNQKVYSDKISKGFDMTLKRWPSYRPNIELDVQEMLLHGKGIEIAEDRTGFPTRSFHNSEILVPEGTRADLTNLGEFAIKRTYTPLEFWRKVSGGHNDPEQAEAFAKKMGWNFWACVEAIRLYTMSWQNTQTNIEWLRSVAANSFNLSRYYTISIQVFELYVAEFNGSISKMLVLQNYGPLYGAYKDKMRDLTEERYIEEQGFLYYKQDWVSAVKSTAEPQWKEIIVPFTDSMGSGLWHGIKGLADRIFVQCRQYDIHMNNIMDAVAINSKLLVKGTTPDATKKMKQMDFTGQAIILPDGVEPQQFRLAVQIADTIQAMQFYQGDLYRGIGAYRINSPTNEGKQRTRGEAELDAAESAQLQGNRIERFNEGHTWWQRLLYKRLLTCGRGEAGHDLKEFFEEKMSEWDVPKDAYNPDNIESIESNYLSGAGSPSFQLMAAQKTLEFTSIVPRTPGQRHAIEDGIASMQGRQNVDRYIEPVEYEEIPEARQISAENIGFRAINPNPENLQVEPTDNHIDHFRGHFSDAMIQCDQAEQSFQQGATPQTLGATVQALMFQGGHMQAHLDFILSDPTKKEEGKKFKEAFSVLQKRVDAISKATQQMAESQQPQQQSKEDAEIQALVAKESIRTKAEQDRINIKLAGLAQAHEQRNQQREDQAVTSQAIQRSKAETDAAIKVRQAQTDELIKVSEAATDNAIKEKQDDQRKKPSSES